MALLCMLHCIHMDKSCGVQCIQGLRQGKKNLVISVIGIPAEVSIHHSCLATRALVVFLADGVVCCRCLMWPC